MSVTVDFSKKRVVMTGTPITDIVHQCREGDVVLHKESGNVFTLGEIVGSTRRTKSAYWARLGFFEETGNKLSFAHGQLFMFRASSL